MVISVVTIYLKNGKIYLSIKPTKFLGNNILLIIMNRLTAGQRPILFSVLSVSFLFIIEENKLYLCKTDEGGKMATQVGSPTFSRDAIKLNII